MNTQKHKIDKKEALEILNKITDECKEHEECNDCPFYIIYEKERYTVWDNKEEGECAFDVPTSRCDCLT